MGVSQPLIILVLKIAADLWNCWPIVELHIDLEFALTSLFKA